MSLIRFNIRFKITLGFAMRLIALLALIAGMVYFGTCQLAWYAFNQQNTQVIGSFDLLLAEGYAYDSQIALSFAAENDLIILVYDESQTLIYSYPAQEQQAYAETQRTQEYSLWDGHFFPNQYFYFVDGTPNQLGYQLYLMRSSQYLNDMFTIYLVPALVILLVLAAIQISSVSGMARHHLKPIHAMTSQVREISTADLQTRLDVRGTRDELKDLAQTFNTMLDDISHSYEREKQFVSDASHELRTPIAVIKGYGALIKRWGKDDPAILSESIDAIVSEADNMQSLVESLLFIARQERGTLVMEFSTFDLSKLIEEIVRETNLIDSQHRILVDVTPNISQYGSMDKLKQAFRILVDNSIKYTPVDGIIQLELKSDGESNVFSVADTGIGISKEDLPYIFDRFYRADKSRTKFNEKESHGGTGLGLSIAKIVIEQHKGSITVASELNTGTMFTVRLPKEAPPVLEKTKKK